MDELGALTARRQVSNLATAVNSAACCLCARLPIHLPHFTSPTLALSLVHLATATDSMELR